MLVPLLLTTFLMLDLSMVIFLRSTFQHAVREGVRYAITGANTIGPCEDDSIKAIVQQNALGFLSAASASGVMHVHFMSPVDGSVSDNSAGNIVEVSVEAYQYGPLAPYQRLNYPVKIWARAYDLMEPVVGTKACITKSE